MAMPQDAASAPAPGDHGRPARGSTRTGVMWLDGSQTGAVSGATFTVVDPYDGSAAASYPNGAEEDTQLAIASARIAFDDGRWSSQPARARAKVLSRAAELLHERRDEFAECMARESGKPVGTGLGELGTAVRTIEYYAGLALNLEGTAVSNRIDDGLGLVLHEPIGVAGLITPWNFPIVNPTVKIAAALCVGCTIVIKPSHLCPGPTLLLAEVLARAGLPPGVLNVVTSDIERGAVVGQIIAASPAVDKVAFTGSTVTGQAVMRAAASLTKRVSLELGGKSANIVFADAPFDAAAATGVSAFCHNSGQQCSAGTRLLVQRPIHERLVAALVQNTAAQVVGDPLDPATTMGPIVNREQFRRVRSYIELGAAEFKLRAGGAVLQPGADDHLLVEPTIFDDVSNSSRLAQEEVFGPVLSVIPFDEEEDAIRLANDSRFGLAGGVWTHSLSVALRVVKGVRTGKMFVNSYNNTGIDDLPHGGYKESGIGREQGPYGIEEYEQLKTVQIRIA
jgi:acyl-CoA reductase-like NAD-dependent aldehyde dehydrogenase